MGCVGSKMEEEFAVAHCRQRSELLAKAIGFRYSLAEAHGEYASSLRAVGLALHEFAEALHKQPPAPPSPHLPLPGHRKGDPSPLPPFSPPPTAMPGPHGGQSQKKHAHSHSRSHSGGSHIDFHSSDESDSEDGKPPHKNGVGFQGGKGSSPHVRFHPDTVGGSSNSPLNPGVAPPPMGAGYGPYGQYGPYTPPPPPPPSNYNYGAGYGYGPNSYASNDASNYGSSLFNFNYAKSQPPPPSVSYEHRMPPSSDAIVEYHESSIHYAKPQPPPPSVSYEQRPQSPEASVHYFSGSGPPGQPPNGYYGGYPYQQPQSSNFYSSYPYAYPGAGEEMRGPGYSASSSRAAAAEAPPPPPPSPPRVLAWDFLNPFESYQSYYEQPPAPYTPSRSSKDVREEEGIPDLEDEEHEVVKEAYPASGKGKAAKEEASSSTEDELHRKLKSSEASSSSRSSLEQEVHVVEKKMAADQVQRPEDMRNVAGFPASVVATKRYHDDMEVVKEIKAQFDRASESAEKLSKTLEVGKMPYYHKSSVYKVSAMICGLPSLMSGTGESFLQFEDDKAMGSGSLSSTLQKLYMWENKLLDEVKAEEKMRVMYEEKREELRYLDERGAEPEKLEATEIDIRKLSTKISIAIQVVNTISNRISRLRDEELWPEICELVHGLMLMWKGMLECHQIQHHAISEARDLDSIVAAGKFSDDHMKAIKHLELVLLNWVSSFSAWVNAQRGYIVALNGWLTKGVNYVPEETDDGVPPFSPGHLGAPPIFVICNYWENSMGRISETEVVDAMQAFATNVLRLWERHKFEQRQRLMANKDKFDKKLRSMERDEQQMRKALEAQNKKLVKVSRQSSVYLSGQILQEGPPAEVGSLQSSLRQIFEAMENFTSASAKTYEDLHVRSEEEKARAKQENGVS